ncbi:MAG: DUF2797 domain-containing protein [Candidatus Thermoplasmatota archaeon]
MRILGFTADGGQLVALACTEGSAHVVRRALVGEFSWRVHPVRCCVGTFGEDFAHIPCPTDEPVSVHRQCLACSGMDDAECIFEPRCQDDPAACTCLTTFKGVPHVVYLAFHGTLPKVGMTTRRRLGRRLWEQGADAYLVLQDCGDRATARSIEKQVSYVYKIPEHRGHRETLPQLARPVPWPQIESRAAELRLRLEGQYPIDRELHRVAGHPIAQPVGGTPRRVPSEGVHRGSWIGCKGNHLVYRETPRSDRLDSGSRPFAALKLSDLIGRRVDGL